MDWFIVVLGAVVVFLVLETRSLRVRVSEAEQGVRGVERRQEARQDSRSRDSLVRLEEACDTARAVAKLEGEMLERDFKQYTRVAALARALGWEYRGAECTLPGWHRIKKGGAA